MFTVKLHKCIFLLFMTMGCLGVTACNPAADHSLSTASSDAKGTRDNTPVITEPKAGNTQVTKNKFARIDTSHSSEGYFLVDYLGSADKVKLRVTAPTDIIYTYNLKSDSKTEVFPFSEGSGTYEILICENISGDNYATVTSSSAEVTLTNDFKPFLYTNQYVAFDTLSKAVKKAEELAKSASTDLEVIQNVYNYVIQNISYDDQKASSVGFDYLPRVDETLETGKGICFDYAALMTSMLRSQNIPTKMQIGFSGEVKHAWISTYTKEQGWIDDIIQFNGKEWKLMDPTFASSGKNSKKILEYIGDGKNYIVKYTY